MRAIVCWRRVSSRGSPRRAAGDCISSSTISNRDGTRTSSGQGYGAESDLTFDEVRVDDYRAVLVLGGRAPEYLRHSPRVLEIVRAFDDQKKWIFAICHGVQILAAAGIIGGKRVTAYENCRWEIEAAGATYVTADQAVRDDRIVTGPDVAVASGVLSARIRLSRAVGPQERHG